MVEIGDEFGRLTVLGPAYDEKRNRKGFNCLCACGNERIFEGFALLRGNNKSCGCLNKTHGMTGSRIYQAWGNMKRRCNDPKNKSYANYGGRGITYDARWERFENFYEDMKETYEDYLTLDRINVNDNYKKDNCRWADYETQFNNMTSNREVTYKGETLTMSRMARKYGLTPDLLKGRIYKGWSIEDAIERPIETPEQIEFNGELKTLKEWAKAKDMTYRRLKKRLDDGWSVERALTEPLRRWPSMD